MVSTDARTALVIGHPGHELRVFHWLEISRPCVFVLTDGSGRSGRPRLASTTRILDQVGARSGSIYGALSDAAAYSAILRRDVDLIATFARQLTRFLVAERITYVAGDALEGYNPAHDVCRLVIGAAVEMANRLGQQTENYEFSLTTSGNGAAKTTDDPVIRLRLDDQALERKLSAARAYAELALEVQVALAQHSPEAFKSEYLRRVSNYERGDRFLTEKPYYEQYGEGQVAAGYYSTVISYREHFLPLAEQLWQEVEEHM